MASAASSTFQGYGDASDILSLISLSFETGKSKIPALARISWLSFSVSRDK